MIARFEVLNLREVRSEIEAVIERSKSKRVLLRSAGRAQITVVDRSRGRPVRDFLDISAWDICKSAVYNGFWHDLNLHYAQVSDKHNRHFFNFPLGPILYLYVARNADSNYQCP